MNEGRHSYTHTSTSAQSGTRTSAGSARRGLHSDVGYNDDRRRYGGKNQSTVRQNGWDALETSPVSSSPQPERPSSRLVYDGSRRPRSVTASNSGATKTGGEREFLVNVQRELEDQRESWRSEIDRLSRSTVQLDTADRLPSLEYFPSGGSSSPTDAGTNSYVDTSGPVPLFKAFVDVSEFDANDVHVTVDKLADKIVVQARQPPVGAAGVSRSFTQRVQLPRFADDARLVARMNHRGILKLEVPLLYYFPPEERDMTRDGLAKSFVYEVRDDPTDRSRQLMEILVNTGHDVSADQLRVEVDDTDGLLITAEKSTFQGYGQPRRHVIKRYTLPPNADVDAITSQLGVDGRLTILIPIKRK